MKVTRYILLDILYMIRFNVFLMANKAIFSHTLSFSAQRCWNNVLSYRWFYQSAIVSFVVLFSKGNNHRPFRRSLAFALRKEAGKRLIATLIGALNCNALSGESNWISYIIKLFGTMLSKESGLIALVVCNLSFFTLKAILLSCFKPIRLYRTICPIYLGSGSKDQMRELRVCSIWSVLK